MLKKKFLLWIDWNNVLVRFAWAIWWGKSGLIYPLPFSHHLPAKKVKWSMLYKSGHSFPPYIIFRKPKDYYFPFQFILLKLLTYNSVNGYNQSLPHLLLYNYSQNKFQNITRYPKIYCKVLDNQMGNRSTCNFVDAICWWGKRLNGRKCQDTIQA